jgi:hypothetical protein
VVSQSALSESVPLESAAKSIYVSDHHSHLHHEVSRIFLPRLEELERLQREMPANAIGRPS